MGNHLFYKPNGSDNLSETARFFIGGMIKYARETSIIMAATFNSYKAYLIGREAPICSRMGAQKP